MNTKIPTGILLAAAAALFVGNVHAQDTQRDDSSWKLLTDDVPRGQLFSRYADSRLAAEGGEAKTFAFPYTFTFAHDAQLDGNTPRTNEIFGIDISHWEGTAFPFAQLKRQSVSFVYTKATQGTDYADPTFDHNWKTLAALPDDQKIPRGAFHFLSSDPAMNGKAQADRFVDYVNLHGKFANGDLRPALDLEWDVTCKTCPDRWQTNHRTPADIIKTTVDFLNEVRSRTNRKPLLYTNKSFLNDNHIDSSAFISQLPEDVKIWIFDVDGHDRKIELPNAATNLDHVLWQFSFGGVLTNGFGGNFDVDVFKGSPSQFDQVLVTDQDN
jgi:lysozyme